MGYRGVVVCIYAAFAFAEVVAGRFLQPRATSRDTVIELVSGLGLPLLVIPAVFTLSPLLVELALPGRAGALAHWPGWLMFAILLVADDFTQYLWHRASHAFPVLFRLHRAHHSGPYISVRTVYRNNLLYYAMMPGLWLSAALVHLGFVEVYYLYVVMKMAVITGAHSSVPWDAWIIRRPALAPVLWVLERVISTPCTHAAHHGEHADDPATHYRGNYGNFLFLWDVLLRTAKITRRRPRSFGLENTTPAPIYEELLWPLLWRR